MPQVLNGNVVLGLSAGVSNAAQHNKAEENDSFHNGSIQRIIR
jgi:hypothetical protein